MQKEARLDQILAQTCAQSREGKSTLACVDAFAIAARFAMPIETFGQLCNERGIRIVQCQLGCFS